MNFSSIPAYLDPSNWQQQQDHQIIIGSSGTTTTTNPLLTPPPPPQPHVGGGIGSIRPGSMSERARMANIPLPETQLKCPRCESTNTKFCYFNNYSLSQPRHFCKTCRRYWTRGGALRSVPVGGGCRRNKRSKSTSSKSPANRGESQTTSTSTSNMATANTAAASMLGLTPPLRFMSPLSHQLSDNFTSDVGLNYGISAPMVGSTSEMNFNGASNLFGGGGMASLFSSGGGIEPWKLQQLQQFPFLGNSDSSIPGVYNHFQGGGESGFADHHHQMRPKFSSSFMTQLSSVKMEDNPNHELSLSRQLMGGAVLPGGNDQWNTTSANWTELSSFSSSSTSNANI